MRECTRANAKASGIYRLLSKLKIVSAVKWSSLSRRESQRARTREEKRIITKKKKERKVEEGESKTWQETERVSQTDRTRERERRNVRTLVQPVEFFWARSARSIDSRASTYEIACWRRRESTDCILRYRVVGYVFSDASAGVTARRCASPRVRRTVNNVMRRCDLPGIIRSICIGAAPIRDIPRACRDTITTLRD